ncbi:MAG: DUF6152 family protein [Pseudohongiellaceae bacterium]|jgi:hypothetical protein|uniref:OB-fold nucleic acid binding domain-containing protein n=1 Tax=OM182 bacterium MED-G28 TaxID=1986256 RepID=A0A2A5W749_9GAMM|nr:MAG: hypothetical protein CNF02_12265 [OM182 bacterium MED-G28]
MRKSLILSFLGALSLLLLTVGTIQAHHAFSGEFDSTQPINLRGTVVRMEWINPHAWLHLSVTDENGDSVTWMIEAGPPGALVRRGWRKDSVIPGIELVVQGYRAIDGTNKANGRDVTFPDGRRLFAGSSGTGAPIDGSDPTEQN